MCDLDFDGHCSVWVQRLVLKSKKDHHCHGCGGIIEKGSSYIDHFSIFDDDPSHEKMCLSCKTIMDAFKREHGREVSPDSLYDFLRECLDEESAPWQVDERDEYYNEDEDEIEQRVRLPSTLSDTALRWKYAILEIEARSAARHAREAAAT